MLTVLPLDNSLQDKVTKSFPTGESEVNNTVLKIFRCRKLRVEMFMDLIILIN